MSHQMSLKRTRFPILSRENLSFTILVKMFSTANYTYDLAIYLITINEQDSSIDVLYFFVFNTIILI